MDGQRLRTSLADAAAGVADLVVGAVRGSGAIGLAAYVNSFADTKVAMGAVRLVGADLFAPHLLLGRPVDTGDAAVIADSFAVFPSGTGGEADTRERRVTAWRDWATGRMLCHANVEVSPSRAASTPAAGTVAMLLGRSRDWREWSANAAALCPLALPGVGGPVQEAVAEGTRPLAQGTTRAMLRRDFVTAARLVRWLALLTSAGVRQPLDPIQLVERIRLYGGSGSRLSLDLTIARTILGMEPA
ncbi:hypothetical protein [Saccharothrix syringae]|uniref:Uncharacterized protein n=1 Tax=Saccharothrix syringae TaxID=103733 RepID=A0A5Q0GXR7_SACSY|nr:hypothetical protein [Saccharothrix syringae]QFZ18693.1 hypothetical protein EKG83_15590 [Saccharothrix syringae]